MTISEITNHVNALGKAWEQFKTINDRRLEEIEKKGSADPVTEEHLGRINNALDNYKNRLGTIETAMSRPDIIQSDASFVPVNNEHRKAFNEYLRKGNELELSQLETKALSVDNDPDGGYLVTPTISDKIITRIHETSPLRNVASVETISTDTLEIIEDKDEAVAGWTTETGSVSDTSTPQLGKKNIPVHELYAQPKATQKLIDDSSIDIEEWISSKVADIFSRKENAAFINGDGVGKPRGILTYPKGTDWAEIQQIDSGINGQVTADGIIQLYYSVKEEHATRGTFLMNRSVLQSVRLLKDTSNQYIWQPGLASGAPDTLLGVPVIQAADMPSAETDSLSVAFGDMESAYQIVDRIGIRILRDPFTDKPFVKFYTTKRVGGDVVNFDAIRILKLAS
ncbi:MAG: phage major capsid protein [Rickettsiales bacterium]|nr:phage major capsid protein [Rickettsiales bacterium]